MHKRLWEVVCGLAAQPTVKSDQLATAWPHEAGSGKPKIEFRATADKFPWAPYFVGSKFLGPAWIETRAGDQHKYPVLQEQNILRLSKTI